jgi:hypothetical protein
LSSAAGQAFFSDTKPPRGSQPSIIFKKKIGGLCKIFVAKKPESLVVRRPGKFKSSKNCLSYSYVGFPQKGFLPEARSRGEERSLKTARDKELALI